MSEPTPENAIALVQALMSNPAVRRIYKVEVWGKSVGIPSDARAAIVSAISKFLVESSTVADGRRYLHEIADAIADMDPQLLEAFKRVGEGERSSPDETSVSMASEANGERSSG